ncbi:MAG: VOC family protein [Pseudomonadota bacterium]
MQAPKPLDKPTDRTVFQNAWVVDDLEAACTAWARDLGVGPFFIADYPEGTFQDVTYRGKPADLSMRVALAQAGPVQIELIQPITSPSAYRDVFPTGQSGFHHLCVWSHDFAADRQYFEALNYPAVNTGRAGDLHFAYFDTRPLLGAMLEIVTWSADIEARFAAIAAAAEDWDGTEPLRR